MAKKKARRLPSAEAEFKTKPNPKGLDSASLPEKSSVYKNAKFSAS